MTDKWYGYAEISVDGEYRATAYVNRSDSVTHISQRRVGAYTSLAHENKAVAIHLAVYHLERLLWDLTEIAEAISAERIVSPTLALWLAEGAVVSAACGPGNSRLFRSSSSDSSAQGSVHLTEEDVADLANLARISLSNHMETDNA